MLKTHICDLSESAAQRLAVHRRCPLSFPYAVMLIERAQFENFNGRLEIGLDWIGYWIGLEIEMLVSMPQTR